MKNRTFYYIVIGLLLILSLINIIFYFTLGIKKKEVYIPIVTISGVVVFNEYEEGLILVIASDEKTYLSNSRQRKIFSLDGKVIVALDKPGSFSLRVPAKSGKIYLEAVNINRRSPIYASYSKNPLQVETGDIRGIVLELPAVISLKEKDAKTPTVTISGNIIFKNYKTGVIFIEARSKDSIKTNAPADIATAMIPAPGYYEVKVPKDIGEIYLTAINFAQRFITKPTPDTPGGYYSKNPIKVKSKDIKNINIEITSTPQSQFIQSVTKMGDYKGSTIPISGIVRFPNYKNGLILVMAKDNSITSGNFLEGNIALAKLDKPGYFSLNVPENSGNIYLYAVNLDRLDIDLIEPKASDALLSKVSIPPYGAYLKNPVKVGTDAISNIEIEISLKNFLLPSFIRQTVVPTIRITGRVNFKDYKSGPIVITARSKKNFDENLLPDLAMTYIEAPGSYVLNVPKEIGEVYIEAINYINSTDIRSTPPPDAPYGVFSNNPVRVEISDLEDIDIDLVFKEKIKK